MMSTLRSSGIVCLVTGAVVAAAMLCACSGRSHQSPGATVTPPPLDGARPPATLAGAESALPLAGYGPSPSQWQVIYRAVGMLQAECMRQRGYHRFTPTATARSPATYPGGGGPFGYVNEGYAARRGFHSPGGGPGPRPMTLTEARVSLACVARAQVRVLGPPSVRVRTAERLLGSLYVKSERDATTDKRVVAATGAWAACMRADGFDAHSPAALVQGPWSAAPSAREIATAKTDAACTSSEHLAGIYFAVLAGYQRELARPYARTLAAVRAEGQSEAARAARIVTAGG